MGDMGDLKIIGAATACGALFLALFAAGAAGLGWATLHSADVCDGMTHSFVKVTTIYNTVLLGLYGIGFLVGILALTGELCAIVSLWINGTILVVTGVVGAFMNIAVLGWGIAALTSDNPCKGTLYYVDAIVVMVLSGMSLFGMFGTLSAQAKA